MLRDLILVGLAALALARPDTYRENEDFKYSRSSTDEGSKSGFYEAQRGNVGGNYERAHNMDTVAQGQMSDVVDQVGAQVSEVAKSNHGNLYGAAYTSGVYGQRKFDTSNLAGRNFHENTFGSSASSGASSRYQQAQGTRSNINCINGCLQTDTVGTGYGTTGYGASHSAAYQSQASGHQTSSTYGQSNVNSNAGQYRVIPVKVSVRPLAPVNMGLQAGVAEHTYDGTFARNEQGSGLNSQNSIGNTDRIIGGSANPSLSHEKHYESAYNYQKQWEKHSEVTPVPLAIPTNVETFNVHNQEYGQNSNLQRNTDTFHTNTYNSGRQETGYESAHKAGYQRVAEPVNNRYVVLSPTPEFVVSGINQNSQSSRHASGYNSHTAYGDQSLAQGHLSTNTDNLLASSINHDALVAINGNSGAPIIPDPKTYESSYSYHKSWERQGDPYIIQPATPVGAQSERLQSYNGYGTKNSRYTSHNSHSSQDDCGDESHRYRRSATYGPVRTSTSGGASADAEEFSQQAELLSQQTEDFGQQSEDFGQQVDLFGQQTEDLGQQTEDLGQQTEDLGQQTEEFGQQRGHFRQNIPSHGQYTRPLFKDSGYAGDISQQQIQHNPQSGWQYVSSSRPQASRSQYHFDGQIQEQADINQEDMGQQVQSGWEDQANLDQQVQTGWAQSPMNLQPQGILINSSDQTQKPHRGNIETTTYTNPNTFTTSFSPTRQHTLASNSWNMQGQNFQRSYLQMDNHNWQPNNMQHSATGVQSKNNDYSKIVNTDNEMTTRVWRPVIQETEVNNQKPYNHPSHNDGVTITPNVQSTTIKTLQSSTNGIKSEDMPVRGDLGSIAFSATNPSTTTRSLSVDNYEKQLREMLHRVQTNNNNNSPMYPTFVSKPKEKTSQEIEALSSIGASSTNKPNVYSSGDKEFSVKPYEVTENVNEGVDKADKKNTSEDFDGQTIKEFNSQFDQQSQDSIFEQQSEQQAENLDQKEDKQIKFIEAQNPIGKVTSSLSQQTINSYSGNPEKINQQYNDEIPAEILRVRPLGISPKDKVQSTSTVNNKPIQTGHNQSKPQNQQNTEMVYKDHAQFEQTPEEIEEETLNLDQQSTDFDQQSETMIHFEQQQQSTYLDQQSTDFGQQSETMINFEQQQQPEDLNVEGVLKQKSSYSQHAVDDRQMKILNKPETTDKLLPGSADMKPVQESILSSKHVLSLDQQPQNVDEKVIGLEKNKEAEDQKKDENPGFWKKVGGKLTSVTDSVSCWFSKC